MFWPSPPWDSLTYWSLDLETGGLDPRRDAILEVGMVPVRRGLVCAGEGWESLVRPSGGISTASIVTHQLVPGEVREAPPLPEVLDAIHERLGDGVLLVHNSAIDVRFLEAAHRACGRRWRKPRVVDTVDLLLKLSRKEQFLAAESAPSDPVLNLAAARQRLGLPDYRAHDALTDALATAELFIVLRRRLGARTLRDLR